MASYRLYDATLSDFRKGQRVQLHPATDLWARGARYGAVAKVGRTKVHVTLDVTGRTVRLAPDNVLPVALFT